VQKKTLILTAVVPLLWACQDTTGPENAGQVTVRFEAATAMATSAQATGTFASAAAVPGPIMIGDAMIDEIKLIVSEIELEGTGGECFAGQDDDCEEIEVGPFLVSLLADNGDEQINQAVRVGTYDELEFEVEDLDADDDDDGPKQAAMAGLLAAMQAADANFPSDASMVVHGTCGNGDFTLYISADIEVEKEFATPFQVPGDQSILVHLDPAAWFASVDLCSLDYGQILHLEGEFEFENGVSLESDD
jgi:hypothetical protein